MASAQAAISMEPMAPSEWPIIDHAYRIPVSSIKSMIGHSLGAIGSIEIAACALAMDQGIVPPTANLTDPDPELDLDYVPLEAREQHLDTVLSVGSGFGGFQSAMVLARPDRKSTRLNSS